MHDPGQNQEPDEGSFNNMERHHNSLNEINVNGNINPANSQNQVVDNSVRNDN
jgi:hypothetical protein